MKLSFKVRTAAMTTLLIAAVAAVSVAGMLLMSRSVADTRTQQELIKAVERNVDEVEYKSGVLEIEDDFAYYAGGVYCDVYSSELERIGGETPSDLLSDAELSAGKLRKMHSGDSEYYIYDTRLDFIKYEYEIDVISGQIIKYEAGVAESEALEAQPYRPTRFDGGVSSDEAVAIALAHAGVSADKAKIISVELPAYSDRQVFAVQFTCDEPLYPPVWIRGVYPAGAAESAFGTVISIIFYILPLFLILSAVGAYLLARRTIRPVKEITDSARAISSGSDLSKRIKVPDGSAEITDLVRTFNDMLERLESSFESEKRFTSDASHELRTPLAVIKAECEYALGANADEADRLEALESVSKQGDKMAQLVDALLAVSRAEQGRGRLKLERLDIGETVRDICDGFVTDKGISLTCTAGNGLSVLADRALIGRLLDNLLSNAVRYGREGGKIEVTVTRVGDNAEIKVSDDGIGIAQEDIPKIWDRFYRADPSRSSDGFGLGLALVRQIALLHSGSVGVESRLGDGSTFTVTMPLDK